MSLQITRYPICYKDKQYSSPGNGHLDHIHTSALLSNAAVNMTVDLSCQHTDFNLFGSLPKNEFLDHVVNLFLAF
jgi:hypothetical protein